MYFVCLLLLGLFVNCSTVRLIEAAIAGPGAMSKQALIVHLNAAFEIVNRAACQYQHLRSFAFLRFLLPCEIILLRSLFLSFGDSSLKLSSHYE